MASTGSAGIIDLETGIIGRGRPFNLTRFNAVEVMGQRVGKDGKKTRTRRAVGVTHDAWGRRQFARGLFILNKKGQPVVKPTGAIVEDSGKPQLRGAWGPGVSHVMEYPHIKRFLVRFTKRRYRIRWPREVRRMLSREGIG